MLIIVCILSFRFEGEVLRGMGILGLVGMLSDSSIPVAGPMDSSRWWDYGMISQRGCECVSVLCEGSLETVSGESATSTDKRV